MPHTILAEITASVSELKKNPMGTVAAGEGFPVAILNRNEPAFYCVPVKAFEALMDRLEDFELNAIADARKGRTCRRWSLARPGNRRRSPETAHRCVCTGR
ncbi:type II toxin-antitoxin system Phd/YefM family antitoxin [Rhizobium gallicum]|uniref:type II toxin-antitoxin system Phd/YefM family antitoxin n=1 Tax=Rhizobium gallicum TaxID=56730 RepID=UPI001EF76450|nr:type II toxin-antitoxin system Phd/YefM family antitoxin [Rhizobium gallicum]ULJ72317.1 type II toxin-antitoxin system Phd/YefM family antitoxin [Rhizobium gallicum]